MVEVHECAIRCGLCGDNLVEQVLVAEREMMIVAIGSGCT